MADSEPSHSGRLRAVANRCPSGDPLGGQCFYGTCPLSYSKAGDGRFAPLPSSLGPSATFLARPPRIPVWVDQGMFSHRHEDKLRASWCVRAETTAHFILCVCAGEGAREKMLRWNIRSRADSPRQARELTRGTEVWFTEHLCVRHASVHTHSPGREVGSVAGSLLGRGSVKAKRDGGAERSSMSSGISSQCGRV